MEMEREVKRKRLYGKFRKSAGKQQKGETESRKKQLAELLE